MKKQILLAVIVFLGIHTAAHATLTTPAIVAPVHGSTGQAVNVMLDWGTAATATYYQYKLSTNPALTGAIATSSGVSTYFYTANLFFSTTYYWQVRAMSATDSSAWSVINQFTTGDGITMVAPANNATMQAVDVMLDWGAVAGITHYDVEFDTTASFNSPLHQYLSVTSASTYYYTSALLFGTKYFWRCRARHANDTTTWSATWNFTTHNNITMIAPANNATMQTVDVMLDWGTVSGITHYDVEFDTSASFTSPLHQFQSVTSSYSYYYMSNLLFGTKYFWRCRARHSNDTTTWSATWNFTTHDNISQIAPTNNATMQAVDVMLDWGTVSGITHYDVEFDTSASFTSPLHQFQSVTSSYSYYYMSNLLFGTKYFWRCRARHANDTTTWSATWNFTTHDNISQIAPANNATQQAVNVMLDWGTVSGITHYDVEFDTSASFTSPLHQFQSVTSSYSYYYTSNLLFGTKYFWRCRARHTNDTTSWSSIWNFTTMNSMSLVSPANGATNQAVNVMLDWGTVSGINAYDVQFDTSASFSSPLSQYISGVNSYYYTSNLRFNTTYYWRARSRHTADTTVWSSVWSFTTGNFPSHISPANASTGITLNPTLDWGTVAGITVYQYEYSTDPLFSSSIPVSTGTTSQAGLINLSYGQTYYWRVRCGHAADTSDWSSPWSFTTLFQLTTPVILSSPINTTSGLSSPVALTWQTYTGAVFYEVQYDNNASFTGPVTGTTVATDQTTAALAIGTTYYWKVRANNGSGYSPWSSVWSFTTSGLGVPILLSPANGASGQLTSGLSLDWADVGAATFYEYEYGTDVLFISPAPIGGTNTISEVSISGLSDNTTYYWRARSSDGTNYSAWSSPWSFTTINTVGIQENKERVLIYPNPASIQLTLEFESNEFRTIEVFDLLGRQVLQSLSGSEQKVDLNVSQLKTGTYIIRILDHENQQNYRFIKQ